MKSPCLRLTALIGSCLLFGAGCQLTQPLVSPRIAEPLSTTLVERPIDQRKGFGDLPAVPTTTPKSGANGTVQVAAELPTVPKDVTVLRMTTGLPNDPQLRNLGGLFSIPDGIIGTHPTTEHMTLDWTDGSGLRWTYDATRRELRFIRVDAPDTTPPAASWISTDVALQTALTFLSDHGVNQRETSPATVEPNWTAWWEGEHKLGRCMTSATLAVIRSHANDPLAEYPFPPLSFSGSCTTPGFSPYILVQMNSTRDGQEILNGDGTPLRGITVAVDATTGVVVAGRIAVPIDPDRSDYPAISQAEAYAELKAGGQGGTPRGDVRLVTAAFQWFVIDDGKTPETTYLYPALVGQGTITFSDGTAAPYRIVVPLVSK